MMDVVEEHDETHVDRDHYPKENVLSGGGKDVNDQVTDIVRFIQICETKDLALADETNTVYITLEVTYQILDFKKLISIVDT